MNNKIENIIASFKTKGAMQSYKEFGGGHINGTYKVSDVLGNKYILQKINKNVFRKPDEVISNIEGITEHIRGKLSQAGKDPERGTINLVSSGDKKYYIDDEGEYWRMYPFIDKVVSLDLPETDNDFYQSALAFGEFQCQLSDYPVEKLYETIPDFHNTPKRFGDFLSAVEQDASGRKHNVEKEIEWMKSKEDFTHAYEKANLPVRVTHNDTKLNNVLLDEKTRTPVCVIDLDTVMPGYSVNDFGDAIRTGASTGAEDEKDLSKVHFDLHKFEVFAKGFVKGTGGRLTKREIEYLPIGAMMMTLEVGMRFLADYIAGDTYFKTAYPDHNLVRFYTQQRLFSEMEENLPEMNKIIDNI